MFKNHILIAVRHLVRYKEYTLINLVGLTIGMACALMIILWADHQVSMDKFHKNGKSIYMLRARLQFPDGQVAIDQSITSPLATVLISEVPEIKDAVRITYLNKQIFNQGEKSFLKTDFMQIVPFSRSFLSIFYTAIPQQC